MFVAAKYEEIYPPKMYDFVYMTNGACTEYEVIQMEVSLLTTLQFDINGPTCVDFLDIYS